MVPIARSWFKRYEYGGTAVTDAENMHLVKTPVTISPSESRYALNAGRGLLSETKIQEDVLETHWHKGPKHE